MPPRRLRLTDILALGSPGDPALSPDAATVAYVLSTPDATEDRDRRELWLVDTVAGERRRLTHGPHDTAPAWSPDGTRLAFLRGRGTDRQVWLVAVGDDGPVQATDLPLGAGKPVWSPDGTRIAFTAAVGAEDGPSSPLLVDNLGFKIDGVGYFGNRRGQVHVLEVATGSLTQVTDQDWHAGTPAWSPSGDALAFPAVSLLAAEPATASAAYVLSLQEQGPPRRVGNRDGIVECVTWFPDGHALLVVGNTVVESAPSRLLRVEIADGETTDLTPAFDLNVMPGRVGYPGAAPAFADGSILFCARTAGYTVLFRLDKGAADPVPLTLGDAVIAGMSVGAAGGKTAVVLSTPTAYPEVAVVGLADGATSTITRHGTVSLPDVELFEPEPRAFSLSDGTTVPGWLLRAPDTAGPAPLLLDIHGGPHNAWSGAVDPAHAYHQVLAAAGWNVLLLNPRGSDGYGRDHYRAVNHAWGESDESDLLEPLDQLIDAGLADPDRVCVAGYSYGGFMTCHLTTRSQRFRAAVAGGVVSDAFSMAGTSDMGAALAKFEFGALPQEDAPRLRSLSPISRVRQVSTPTLILHGQADDRSPLGQAEQWFTALRQLGVDTRLVVYPGATHTFTLDGRPSHRLDYQTRLVEWLTTRSEPAAAGRQTMATAERRPAADWGDRLARVARECDVPGAVLGILTPAPNGRSDIVTAAYGVLNRDTGVRTTTDSLFQVGSITKIWTTSVLMRLIEEGLVDVDTRIADVLPDLQLSTAELTKSLTLRHLLTHTSGLGGDVFADTGRGDDCIARFVEHLAKIDADHPLGATMSYCNSGFVIAGRVIEVLTGLSWDAAVKRYLIKPLGLRRTVTLPEEALLGRAAVGHLPGEQGQRPAPFWMLPRNCGPSGLITTSMEDLLTFARMHLMAGASDDGRSILSPTSVKAMQTAQVEIPARSDLAKAWGLGWMIDDWDGNLVVGHDGATIGQTAFLRLLPDKGIAIALFANGGNVRDLLTRLFADAVAEVAGVRMPLVTSPPTPPSGSVDHSRFLGAYARTGTRIEVLERDGHLVMKSTDTADVASTVGLPTTHDLEMVAVSDGLCFVRGGSGQSWSPVTFYELSDGTRYLHHGFRANRRIG
ncbi:serine hydrolase [Nonomuraea zeae]|uniref:Serine hydrolase n=1 Tax=Nonomuraea zeae TaxID=1642303 RepID=A0A5S4G5I4_9ACTN|nr:serine hydrolase [Nonomuraea zeae]TMR27774.1 serine hydrolase [Nonomuraea zeae]